MVRGQDIVISLKDLDDWVEAPVQT